MSSVDGLITGLNTTAIIDQLLAVERIPQNQLLVQQATAEARVDVFANLRGRYDAVESAAKALDLPDDWAALTATSSSELVDVQATSGSVTGAINFSVTQRAAAHVVYSTQTLTSLDAVVAPGGSVFSARDFSSIGFSDLSATGLAVGAQTMSVTQASAAAVKAGGTALVDNVTINGTNNTINISVNGTAHSLTVAQATYATRADLVAAVQTSFDAVIGLDDKLSVRLNPANQLEFLSIREGTAATLQVTGGTALTVLGLTTDVAAITGVDGIVTVNGVNTTVTNTDKDTVVSLGAGVGTISATLSGALRLGAADIEQKSFGNGTLTEVATAVNGAGNSGTSAAIIQVSDGNYRLQLTSTDTGAAAAIDLSLTQFTGLTGFTTLSTGQDAQIQIAGTTPYTVSSATNTFEDLLPGVDVTLTGSPTGTVTIDVTRDSSTISSRVETLVSAVNNVIKGLQESSAYDSDEKSASLLTGNSTIRRALDELTRSLVNPVSGASLGSVGLTGLTIETDGTFKFDKAIFKTAYDADPTAVERVYSVPFGSTDDSAMSRILAEVKDATAFGTGYLRSAEDAENLRVDDLKDSIASWDRRLEKREASLRALYTRLEVSLGILNAQSNWLAGQVATLSTPNTGS